MDLEDDLRQVLRDKPDRVVWVVGPGVPRGALRGTPSEPYTSWAGLARSGLRRIHELGRITSEELADLERLLGHNSFMTWRLVAEKIEQELGAPMSGEFRRWLRETVGEFERHLVDRTVLDALADHQRRGGLLTTTNYDILLETTTGLPAATWRSPADAERALRGDEPQVLHLHGVWRSPDSVVLGIHPYDDGFHDPHARAVMRMLCTDRTLVFVGADLHDPNTEAFLRWIETAYAGSEYRHFRLCRESELDSLRREYRYEQHILPLSYGYDLAPFLRSLLPPGATSLHAPVQSPPRTEAAPVLAPPLAIASASQQAEDTGFLATPFESVRGVTRSASDEQVYLNVWFPKFEPRAPRFVVDEPIDMHVDLGPQHHDGARPNPISESLKDRLRRLTGIDVWVQCADADVTPGDGTLLLPWPTNVLAFQLVPRRSGGLRIVVVLLIKNQPVHRLEREVQVQDPRDRGARWG